uniref:Uncharacterized protein n=1 Tax=Anguilla anguilla TaxID=7936 RepID=A0A0E9QQE8_ANGAN
MERLGQSEEHRCLVRNISRLYVFIIVQSLDNKKA